ncbi:MAG: KpsF/GutQ family sugar-phosphate isomerase [Parachlamydia sp.]|nr:KpsF/GutQ family sugar-phosphate isomerase [Parachlamydia sp.]
MLKELLDNEREALDHFFTHVDHAQLQKLLEILQACKGIVIITGVGKSGLVAEKFAVTLTSTGSRALYLSPANALHGDIGIITDQDVFIMLSKSGESDELLNLVPYVRNKGAKIIAIVTNPASRLGKACDFSLTLPLERELCPYDLAPTTSTVIQMIVGDVLAIALMRLKNISYDQYAMNHPAGRIGRRIFTKVKDLMLTGQAVPLCHPEERLMDVLVTLSDKRCGCILVVDAEQRLLGIFTDGDLRRSLQKLGVKSLESNMEELMTRTPRWISDKDLAWAALLKMEADQKHPITVLAVLNDEEQVVGVIKMHDIVQSGL